MKLLKLEPVFGKSRKFAKFRLISSQRPRAYIDFDVRAEAQNDRRVFANIIKMERRALRVWMEDNAASRPFAAEDFNLPIG